MIALLQGVGGPWAYIVVGVLALAESAAMIGLVVPGETVMLLGGVLAAFGQVDLLGMMVAGVLGAVLGDQAGYALGRIWGPTLRSRRLGHWIGQGRWARAEDLVARRGGPAVFLARWVGVLRAVVPAAAGAVGMPRRVFVTWNAVGGTLWAVAVVGAGYLAGASWPVVQSWLGGGALVLGGVAGGVVLVALVRRHFAARRGRAASGAAGYCATSRPWWSRRAAPRPARSVAGEDDDLMAVDHFAAAAGRSMRRIDDGSSGPVHRGLPRHLDVAPSWWCSTRRSPRCDATFTAAPTPRRVVSLFDLSGGGATSAPQRWPRSSPSSCWDGPSRPATRPRQSGALEEGGRQA